MHHDFFFGHGTHQFPRAQRGILESVVLRLLNEKPMHGYEIIRTLEERSHGFWRPSPGSVYPILQFLEEQELVESKEEMGKKVYAITEKGKEQVKTNPHPHHHPHPFANRANARHHFPEMMSIVRDCTQLMKQIIFNGSEEQIKAATNTIKETRDKLKTISTPKQEN